MDLLTDFDSVSFKDMRSVLGMPLQNCPNCQAIIGAIPGGRDATCKNCGYKDPCCE